MQRRAAGWIEMSENLIEQQNGSRSRHLSQQSGMCKHKSDQERLLLAGRSLRGSNPLCGIDDFQVAQMRSVERPTGGRVTAAVVAQYRTIARFDVAGRICRNELFERALDFDFRRWKRRVPAPRQHGDETANGLDPQTGYSYRKLRGLMLDRFEPVMIRARVLQKPISRT